MERIVDFLAEELKLEAEAIASFGKFFPKALQAFGGPVGLQNWLAGTEGMTASVGRILRAENDRVCKQFPHDDDGWFTGSTPADVELQKLSHTKVWSEIWDAVPSLR